MCFTNYILDGLLTFANLCDGQEPQQYRQKLCAGQEPPQYRKKLCAVQLLFELHGGDPRSFPKRVSDEANLPSFLSGASDAGPFWRTFWTGA